jgi:hypothetical protein
MFALRKEEGGVETTGDEEGSAMRESERACLGSGWWVVDGLYPASFGVRGVLDPWTAVVLTVGVKGLPGAAVVGFLSCGRMV